MPPMLTNAAEMDIQTLQELYTKMLLIRRTEERLQHMFADGEIPGFIHLSIGQEGVAAGVAAALSPSDTLASTHRGHGHAIAKGVDLTRFFLEILGREAGLCGGRGGSMHVADLTAGMLGANGIVGAGLSIAAGSALAHKVRGTNGIAVAFFGDGAIAEGIFHESLNLAALWGLPFLGVCENNGWAEFSPTSKALAANLAEIATAYGIPCVDVDGNDVEAVALAARQAVDEIRSGKGPYILECRTTRFRGHFEGDAQKYRSAQELEEQTARDPLFIAAQKLTRRGVTEAVLKSASEVADNHIEDAVAKARSGALPDFARARADVYTAAEAGS